MLLLGGGIAPARKARRGTRAAKTARRRVAQSLARLRAGGVPVVRVQRVTQGRARPLRTPRQRARTII